MYVSRYYTDRVSSIVACLLSGLDLLFCCEAEICGVDAMCACMFQSLQSLPVVLENM